ncbi:hypothetical protein EVAR_65704_1 [Eumeta japonica]|uniref:Endonuclease/exonuclease/phosphatase domain-containing protein n=1 Tax=Eumeta variegata TaxID=151549 RepID=A0A4C2AAY3_EUMVA|nr:hypothetical protein EVAR_65704_1 [Eumeta japonica]
MGHSAQSAGSGAKWDDMARSKVAYCSSRRPCRRPQHMRPRDRRPKDALTAYLCGLCSPTSNESCPKDGSGGPVKAAIMVLNSDVDVEEDQTLNGENVAAAVIKAGNCRIGVVSVYFEETCPSARTSIACDTSAQNSGPTKSSWGDVNAWSVWWGSERNDARGVDLCDFLDSEGLHILNEGNTPTFEVYRGIVSWIERRDGRWSET